MRVGALERGAVRHVGPGEHLGVLDRRAEPVDDHPGDARRRDHDRHVGVLAAREHHLLARRPRGRGRGRDLVGLGAQAADGEPAVQIGGLGSGAGGHPRLGDRRAGGVDHAAGNLATELDVDDHARGGSRTIVLDRLIRGRDVHDRARAHDVLPAADVRQVPGPGLVGVRRATALAMDPVELDVRLWHRPAGLIDHAAGDLRARGEHDRAVDRRRRIVARGHLLADPRATGGRDHHGVVIEGDAPDPHRAIEPRDERPRHELDRRAGDRPAARIDDVDDERRPSPERQRHRFAGVVERDALGLGVGIPVLGDEVVLALGQAVERERAVGLALHGAPTAERDARAADRGVVRVDDLALEPQHRRRLEPRRDGPDRLARQHGRCAPGRLVVVPRLAVTCARARRRAALVRDHERQDQRDQRHR